MKVDIDHNWLIVKYSDEDARYLIRMDTVIAVEKGPELECMLDLPQVIVVTPRREYKLTIFDGDVPGHEKWESRDIIFNDVMNAILQYTQENDEQRNGSKGDKVDEEI